MNYFKRVVTLIIILLTINNAIAQQIWPVQLNGVMIPPRSLDLSVYNAERRQDLYFNATLLDPVVKNMPVTLRLTIESNGNIVYRTDPNFFGPTINLRQFQPVQINGGTLQPYMTPNSLVGATNNGKGSLEIPEGFDRICLEVIGVDRRVAISKKFCVQGSFQLNAPPQLAMPICGDQMKMPASQNLIFNWRPMHIGSSNSPNPVEYKFELVQLPDGVNNANDAFESSLKLYQTKSMTPSILYTEGQPKLKIDKTYAWRVQAYSLLHKSSKLFQNKGYSTICTFRYYGEDGPTGDNATDRPSPTGCEVFATDYGPITSNVLEAIPIVEEDEVKLGYFKMEITQATAGGSGFSGTGMVTVPMFNSKVNVKFKGLRVNSDMRVFEAASVTAITDRQFELSNDKLNPATIKNVINDNYIKKLNRFFTKGNGVTRMISGLNPADPIALNLPIGIDQDDKPLVAVFGINFTPRNAYLNLVSWTDDGKGNKMRFAGTAIQSTPYGIKSGAHLVALGDGESGSSGTPITDIFSLDYSAQNGSKLACDCKGAKKVKLKESVTISTDVINKLTGNGPISLLPKAKANSMAEYVGQLKNIGSFTLTSLPDFVFKPKKAYLDLSKREHLSESFDQSSYNNYTENDWIGLILDDVKVIIPKSYDFTGRNKKIELDKGTLFIGANKIAHGDFKKTNLLSLENGKMGDWAYSVDTFGIKIIEGKSAGANMSGQVQVPIFSDKFSYNGSLQKINGQINLGVEVPNKTLKMDMWKANFEPDTQNSNIDAKLTDAGTGNLEFFPNAAFSGKLSIELKSDELENALLGNIGQIKSELTTILGVTNFDLSLKNVVLNDLILDPFVLPENRYALKSTDLDEADITIGGNKYKVGQVDLDYTPKSDSEEEKLGLRVVVLDGNNKVEFTFIAKPSPKGFIFKGIEVRTVDIQCECTSFIGQPSDESWGRILDKTIDNNYGYLFDKEVSSGSLAAFGLGKTDEMWQTKLHFILKEQLSTNHIGGFPLLDNGDITIGFLDGQAVKLDGFNRGVIDPNFKLKSGYTFANIEAKNKDKSKKNMLPIDVTDKLDKLGVKISNLPAHTKLLITGFQVDNNVDPWKGGKMELTLVYEVFKNNKYESYLRFSKKNIPVGANSVDFTSLYMHLEAEGKNGDNDEVIYMPGDGSKKLETGSFAYMNCTEGFKFFNVQGIYKAAFSDKAGNKTNKIVHRLANPVNGHSAKAAQFGFTVNSKVTIKHFIAPLKKNYDDTGDWNFSASGAEQVIFRPGDNFNAYIDFDNEDSHQDQPDIANVNGGNVPAFMGLVFKQIIFEVDGLKLAGDKAFTQPITNVVFDATRGVQASFSKTDPIKRNQNALLGGWKYDVSLLAFLIVKSTGLTTDGVAIEGNILVPILDEKPPNSDAVSFESGWVGYKGTIDFDAAGDKYEPDATLQVNSVEDKLFHSSFIPGLGMELNKDSKIALGYNSGNKEFEASCDFSGKAGIWLNKTIIEAKFGNKKPSGIGNINFIYELFKFEHLKINDGDAVSNCTGGGSYNGIKAIEFGTWGILEENEKLGNAADKISKGFQGFPVTIGQPRFSCSGQNEYRMTLPVNLNLMSDEKPGPPPATGTRGLGGGARAAATKPKPKTSGLNAAGELGFIIGLSDQGLSLKRFELGCLLVEGAFGPLKMKGGLNMLRSDGADTQWGDGFKAFLEAEIASVNVKATAQFGVTNFDKTSGVGTASNNNKYRYFFVDIEGTSEAGLPIGYPPVAKLYGIGGGFRYNMARDADPIVKEESGTNASNEHANNDGCALADDHPLMGAGVSLSGASYVPDNGTYGAYIKIIAGAVSPQVFVGDLAVDIGITKNKSNSLAFESIFVRGEGYFQAQSVADRKSTAVGEVFVDIGYTVSNKTLSGSFGIKAEYPPLVPYFKIPDPDENYNQTGDYANGQLDINFGNGEWGFKFGSWKDPEGKIAAEPNSKLPYNTAVFSAGDMLGDLKLKFYVQAGHKVDNIPPIEAVVPDWDNGGVTQKRLPPSLFKSGNGMVMGMKMEFDMDEEFGPFRARLNGGIGFDLSMIKYENIDCGNGGIGFNNWFMQGQAYAYAAAMLDMKYKLPFKSGTIRIFDLYAALVLQAKFPNPSYFKGQLQARYAVLGGLLKGKANVKLELGEQCSALENASPIAGIKMVSDVYPRDKNKDISIFTSIKMTTNLAIGSALTFPNYDDKGNIKNYENYRAVVDYVKVKKQGTSNYLSASIQTEDYGLTLKFNKLLDPHTTYQIEYRIAWEEDKDDNGTYNPLKDGNKYVEEVDLLSFTTGAFPDKINNAMVEYLAPGDRQRYWHSGYASPMLRFNTSDPKLSILFPETTIIGGNEVRNEYIAQIIEYGGSNGSVTNNYTIPVVSYPSSKTFKKAVAGEISVGSVYTIPTVSIQNVTVNEIKFPGLAELNLAKGKMCRLQLIRQPEASAFSVSIEETTGENGVTVANRKLDTGLETELAENTKILYEYHFAVSKYSNLHDKLASTSVKYIKSNVKRTDFNHPDEATLTAFDPGNQGGAQNVKDDYFSFDAKSNGEGFDKFDLKRIRHNARITYLDRYGPKTAIKTWRYGGVAIHPYVTESMGWGGYSEKDKYLKTILHEYSSVAQEKDGTYWNYNFYINPTNSKRYHRLSDNELNSKRLDNTHNLTSSYDGSYNSPVFGSGQEYGLLFQDLRSRILINQMRWLGDMGYHEGHRYYFENKPTRPQFADWHRANFPYGDIFSNGSPHYDWITPAGWNDSHVYIAEGDGYKYSYHGRIKIEFPKVSKWKEIDSKVNINQYPKIEWTLKPNHSGSSYDNTSSSTNTIEYSDISEQKWYRLQFKHSNLSLRAGNTGEDGSISYQWYNQDENLYEKFRFKKDKSTDTYEIINANSGKCQTIRYGATGNGEKLIQWKCSGADHHKWYVEDAGNGYVKIRNKKTNKYLLIGASKTDAGAQASQWSYIESNSNNKIKLRELKNSVDDRYWYRIEFKHSKKNLEIGGNSKANGSKSQQWSWVGTPSQQWRFVNHGLYYQIINRNSGKTLEISGQSKADGGRAQQWDWLGNPNQTWSIENLYGTNTGYYRIKNSNSNKFLCINYSSSNNGAYAHQWTWQPNDNKRVKLIKLEKIEIDSREKSIVTTTSNNTTTGAKLRFVKDRRFVQLRNMTYDQIPKYAYLIKDDRHPIAMWNGINNVLTLYNANNSGEVRLIPNVDFNILSNGTSYLYDFFSLKEAGYRSGDLYHNDVRLIMMDDNGKYIQASTTMDLASMDNNIPFVNSKQAFFAKHSLPYNGIYQNIPGIIEPANYDWGGPGIAYNDNEEGNHGNGYRMNEGVDLYVGSDGKRIIGWTSAGEWQKYSVNIEKSGRYSVIVEYGGRGNIQLKLNGINIGDELALPAIGFWPMKTQSVTLDVSSIQTGIQKLSVHQVTGGMNIGKLQFIHQPPAAYAGSPLQVPYNRIEAENFDKGGEGVAYHDIDAQNRGNSEHRSGESVDIQKIKNASKGKSVGWMNAKEWLGYTIEVAETKKYNINIGYARKSGNGFAKIYLDGKLLGNPKTFSPTGNWMNWKESNYGTFTLSKGVHELKYETGIQGVNLDYIDIKDAASTPYAKTTVPGIIPIGNYDNGGEGVAYHKANTSDLKRSKATYYNDGAWARYTFEVSESKPMAIFVKDFGGHAKTYSYTLAIDGISITEKPTTGTYLGEVTLSPGTHVLTLKGIGEGKYGYLAGIEFKAINPIAHNNIVPTVPCRIEFEQYAQGGKGIGWFNKTLNKPKLVYNNTGIELINGSTWFNYPINVSEGGEYNIDINYGGKKGIIADFYVDGTLIKNDVKLPNAGIYHMGHNKSFTFNLKPGKQILKVLFRDATGSVYLNYFDIRPTVQQLQRQGVALKLDGTNDCVALPNALTSSIGGSDAITIEYWFKGTNVQSAVRLQNSAGYIIAGWNNPPKWIISSDGGTSNGLSLNKGEIYDNKWHHVAMTWQRDTENGFKLYLDGEIKGQRNSANVSLPNVSSNGFIGCYNGSSELTNGSIDEVRIWNRALSENEIKAGMNCNPDTDAYGLLARYNFDDKNVNDKTGKYNGTARGFTTTDVKSWVGSFGKITESCQTQKPSFAFNIDNVPTSLTNNAVTIDLGDKIPMDGEPIVKTITIENKGHVSLAVSNFQSTTNNDGFEVSGLSQTSIAPGENASFTVSYSSIIGVHNANISWSTNDPNQSSVNIEFKGSTVSDGANRSIKLDGSNDCVALPNALTSSIGGTDAMTIEYWFKGTKVESAVRLQDGNGFIVAGWSDPPKWIISTDGYVTGLSLSSEELYDDQWHHVAMTWQRNTDNGFKLYLDGVIKKQRKSANTSLPKVTTQGYIGSVSGTSGFTNGSLDEVRIWNRALSTDEINNWRYCQPASNAKGLVAYYNFNDKNLKNIVNNVEALPKGFASTDADKFIGSFGQLSGNCDVLASKMEVSQSGKVMTSGSSTIDFGKLDQAEGDQLIKTIVVKNIGNKKLNISSVQFMSNSNEFSLSQPKLKAISPGQTTSFKVIFNPNKEGKHAAQIKILSDDKEHGSGFKFDASGTFIIPEIKSKSIDCSPLVSSYPYLNSFDFSLGDWKQDKSDNIDWSFSNRRTPSNWTGPYSPKHSAAYMFVEASGRNYPYKSAKLISPCFNLEGKRSASVLFYYHMYGYRYMGSLDLQISEDGRKTWKSLVKISGNKWNRWRYKNINLSAYLGKTVAFRFVGITGTGYRSDMAIDYFKLTAN